MIERRAEIDMQIKDTNICLVIFEQVNKQRSSIYANCSLFSSATIGNEMKKR